MLCLFIVYLTILAFRLPAHCRWRKIFICRSKRRFVSPRLVEIIPFRVFTRAVRAHNFVTRGSLRVFPCVASFIPPRLGSPAINLGIIPTSYRYLRISLSVRLGDTHIPL